MSLEKRVQHVWQKVERGTSRWWGTSSRNHHVDIEHWPRGEAESHCSHIEQIEATLEVLKENAELLLLSEDSQISRLARDFLEQKQSTQEKKKLEILEKRLADIWDGSRLTSYYIGTPEAWIAFQDRFKKTVQLIEKSPVEALTSKAAYVREIAAKTLDEKLIKQLKKKIKRNRNTWKAKRK